MSDRTVTLAIVLGGLSLTWAGIAVYVIVTRAIYDVQTRAVDASRRTAHGHMAAAVHAGDALDVDKLVGRLRGAALLRAATDMSTPTAVARVFSQHLLHRSERRIRALLVPRRGRRWKRVGALRVAALGGLPDATVFLRDAVRSPDKEVQAAGIRILGELGTPAAHAVLVEALKVGTFARSRIAAQLEGASLSVETLRPLLDDTEAIVRYWGAKLLEYASASLGAGDALLRAAADDDANVRAAAAASLASNGSEQATRALLALLEDASAQVRLHAARSIGRRGTVGAAEQVASLLRDRDWWVRTSAKRALESLGTEAVPAVMPYVRTNDEFARNSAAEVLQNLGLVRTLVDRVATATNGDREVAAAELAPILSAGGSRFASLALEHLDGDGSARVHALVGDLP